MTQEEFWKNRETACKAFHKFIHPYDEHVSVMPVNDEVWFMGGYDACKKEILNIIEESNCRNCMTTFQVNELSKMTDKISAL